VWHAIWTKRVYRWSKPEHRRRLDLATVVVTLICTLLGGSVDIQKQKVAPELHIEDINTPTSEDNFVLPTLETQRIKLGNQNTEISLTVKNLNYTPYVLVSIDHRLGQFASGITSDAETSSIVGQEEDVTPVSVSGCTIAARVGWCDESNDNNSDDKLESVKFLIRVVGEDYNVRSSLISQDGENYPIILARYSPNISLDIGS